MADTSTSKDAAKAARSETMVPAPQGAAVIGEAEAQAAGLWAPSVAGPAASTAQNKPEGEDQLEGVALPAHVREGDGAAHTGSPTITPDAETPPTPDPQPPRQATGPAALMPRWSWVDRWAMLLTPIFDGLARVRIIAAACVMLVAIAAFIPGFTTIPPVDRDESRFSQATRQMVATGDYVDIRFQNAARYQKPIGIYWLQSVAVHLYGAEDGQAPIWVYRTVSFVGAVAAAGLVYWLALALGTPPIAFAAGLLVALTILLGAEARLAKTDAMLFATILMAQGGVGARLSVQARQRR